MRANAECGTAKVLPLPLSLVSRQCRVANVALTLVVTSPAFILLCFLLRMVETIHSLADVRLGGNTCATNFKATLAQGRERVRVCGVR